MCLLIGYTIMYGKKWVCFLGLYAKPGGPGQANINYIIYEKISDIVSDAVKRRNCKNRMLSAKRLVLSVWQKE